MVKRLRVMAVSVTLLRARADGDRREALVADLRRLARHLASPMAGEWVSDQAGR